jgi:hypothetical protein
LRVPLAVVESWLGTIRWVCPGQDVRRARAGPGRESSVAEFMCGDHWLVMTYKALVYAQEELLFHARLDDGRIARIGLAICDEAHVLNNSTSAVHEAVRSLRVDKRLLLTATPSPGGMMELHSLINFIEPGAALTEVLFRSAVVNPLRRHFADGASTLTEVAWRSSTGFSSPRATLRCR